MRNETLEAVLIIDAAWRRRHARAGSVDADAREAKAAIDTLRNAVLAGLLADAGTADAPIDADAVVRIYIASGAKWRDLVAAVSRHALDAQARREEE